jgi:hypothetical protein
MWHNYCWLWRITQDSNGFSECGTITADCDKWQRSQMASQNMTLLLLIVINYTGFNWLLRMWQYYCWQWKITQHLNGFSKCGTITAECDEITQDSNGFQIMAILLLTMINYTGLE